MLLSIIALCVTLPDEPLFSGPQPGEKLVPFEISGVFGKDADQKLDVVSEAKEKPCVLIFVHERSRPAFGLSNLVMRLVEKRGADKVIGGLVFLTDDPTETASWMNQVAQYFPKQIRMGVSADGLEGPGAYGLNRKVALTVLVAKDSVVTANFALVQPSEEVDGPKIFKAISEALGEAEVPSISEFQLARRSGAEPMQRDATAQDPNLPGLLRPLIQKTATDDEVLALAKKVEDYATEHPMARIQIGDIARRIIEAGKLEDYGTPKCQEFLTKWSREFIPDAEKSDDAKAKTKSPDAKPSAKTPSK